MHLLGVDSNIIFYLGLQLDLWLFRLKLDVR